MQIRANANENQVIHVSSAARDRAQERAGINGQEKQKRSTIFMGDLNVKKDSITQRKLYAQQKALKIVSNAWEGDRKIDNSILDIRHKLSQLQDEYVENLGVIDAGDAQKEMLRQQYGVAADSQEQKDLELLQKKEDAMHHPDEVSLTEEEEARLKEINGRLPDTKEEAFLLQRKQDAEKFGLEVTWTEEEEALLKEMEGIPLTEYQKRCLNIDKHQRIYEQKNDIIEDQIIAYSGSIRAMKLERLKFHEMTDAQKKAEDVMEAAGKEIIGMLMEEAKDHVDEEMDEKKEEAEEKAEEKAEQEEKIEDRKEDEAALEERIDEAQVKREEQEELRRDSEERSREESVLLDDILETGRGQGSLSDVQLDVKKMLHKMKLLEEDLKGSIVDEES